MQPDSPFNGLEGLKHLETAIVPPIYDPTVADENVECRTEDAYVMVKRLAREEGLLVGISAGGNVHSRPANRQSRRAGQRRRHHPLRQRRPLPVRAVLGGRGVRTSRTRRFSAATA